MEPGTYIITREKDIEYVEFLYRKDGTYCCYGHKWDLVHNICIPCDDGFFGTNCASKCPYPKFGKGCHSSCTCDVQKCDHANGCIPPTKSISNVTEADTTMNLTNLLRETTETKQEMINTLLFE